MLKMELGAVAQWVKLLLGIAPSISECQFESLGTPHLMPLLDNVLRKAEDDGPSA